VIDQQGFAIDFEAENEHQARWMKKMLEIAMDRAMDKRSANGVSQHRTQPNPKAQSKPVSQS